MLTSTLENVLNRGLPRSPRAQLAPTLVAEEEHAVDTLTTGPPRWLAMEMWPAAALFIPSTTAVGRTRPLPA